MQVSIANRALLVLDTTPVAYHIVQRIVILHCIIRMSAKGGEIVVVFRTGAHPFNTTRTVKFVVKRLDKFRRLLVLEEYVGQTIHRFLT